MTEEQFRFTDENKTNFEELAKNANDENKKELYRIIQFLNAVERPLQLLEASSTKNIIDTSKFYENLNLGRNAFIKLTTAKTTEPKPTEPQPTEQSGGTRANPHSEFMLNYIKEYINTDKLMLTPLTKFTDLVEQIYTLRTISHDNSEELHKTFSMSLDIISYILKIISQGSENDEQKFLIQSNTTQPIPVYLIIMQSFLDMITLVLTKVNYLNDPAEEAGNKQALNALYNVWKDDMVRKGTPQNAFDPRNLYSAIEKAVTG